MHAKGAFLVPTTVTYAALKWVGGCHEQLPVLMRLCLFNAHHCGICGAQVSRRGCCRLLRGVPEQCACAALVCLSKRAPTTVRYAACDIQSPYLPRRDGVKAGMPADLVAKVADAVEQVCGEASCVGVMSRLQSRLAFRALCSLESPPSATPPTPPSSTRL